MPKIGVTQLTPSINVHTLSNTMYVNLSIAVVSHFSLDAKFVKHGRSYPQLPQRQTHKDSTVFL